MSNAMIAAIKAKKAKGMATEGDHQDMGHSSQHADDKQKDLHGFVQGLSEDDKHQLKSILQKDSSDNSMAIAKGGASTEEQGKIGQAMSEENQHNALEAQEDEARHPDQPDTDAIGKSMLDSRYMSATPPEHKPRNLGERVKMSIASKLKSKGKI